MQTQISQDATLTPPEIVRRLVTSHFISQAVYVVAKLNLAEYFAVRPCTAAEVAIEAGLNERSLFRLLRALADVGVFAEVGDGTFALTPIGNCLRAGVPGSMRMAAILFGEEPYRACFSLLESVRTGETAFDRVYGMGHFKYLAQNEEAARTFHEAMTDLTTLVGQAVVRAHDFSDVRRIVDVGAGEGLLLAAILNANADMEGILFEAPPAMAGAERLMASQGLGGRFQLVPGNFFESVPAGGDAYLLKSVIHDWDDARSIQILKNVRRVVPDNGRLLVVERVIPSGREKFFGRLNDLIMLVVSGGCERTEAEYQHLFAASGFLLAKVVPTGSGFHVIEGIPMV